MFLNYDEFINEAQSPFKHKINSEKYWRRILDDNRFKFALDVLNTVVTKQNGMATDRQWTILKRAENGDTSPYSTKS